MKLLRLVSPSMHLSRVRRRLLHFQTGVLTYCIRLQTGFYTYLHYQLENPSFIVTGYRTYR